MLISVHGAAPFNFIIGFVLEHAEVIYQRLGQLVRHHRERLGQTQQQLAESVNLSRTSISNIESGRQRILVHQIFEFASALELPAEVLFPATVAVNGAGISPAADLHGLSVEEQQFVRLATGIR
jgi:transcriptional regulator with XRE-family HTH domain